MAFFTPNRVVRDFRSKAAPLKGLAKNGCDNCYPTVFACVYINHLFSRNINTILPKKYGIGYELSQTIIVYILLNNRIIIIIII